jgi:ORF6N domain-containing protein
MKTSLVRIPVERIERAIYLVRSQKVMLDRDLADLYEVETKALNRSKHRDVVTTLKNSCIT